MKTILITGCSSGFGRETARYFLEHGWKVVATMRTPREDVLPSSEHLRVLPLDVTDPDSIREAVDAAGLVDVLVNNAGFGAAVPFELTSLALARELLETNMLGTMAVTQAVLPRFRERRAGIIVNVSSSVTLKSLPLVSVYTASKAAVNAFTESMAIELAPFGVSVRLVLPGRSPETRFGANAHVEGLDDPVYSEMVQRVISNMRESSGPVTHAEDVARTVWRAATEPESPMRLPAGADAEALAAGTA